MLFLDAFLRGLRQRYDNDWVDRLHNYWTPMLLIIFALTLSAKQYVGQPIQCWIPSSFTGPWEQYTENICFIKNTFYLNPRVKFPNVKLEEEGTEIRYYQWVPLVLGLQALFFYLPSMLWKYLNLSAEFRLKEMFKKNLDSNVVGRNNDVERANESDLDVQSNAVAGHMYAAVMFRMKHQNLCVTNSMYSAGSYLGKLYIGCKIAYMVQTGLQFVLLNHFLSPSYTFWGFGILKDLINGKEWTESGHFPRVTFCEYDIYTVAHTHRNIVQCVLMINMFNEKVYIFLWFWMMILEILSLFNLISWCRDLFLKKRREEFIANSVLIHRMTDQRVYNETTLFDLFVNRFLDTDGVFIAHLMRAQRGPIFVHHVFVNLWNRFLRHEDEETRTE